MSATDENGAARAHENNVGVVRLALAACVIVGHAPEMLDGDRARDPVHSVFGVLSLGTVAVDAFFLISGFLITSSMLRVASVREYLIRRVLRIYPAFIVAYLISVYLVGPLVGAHPWSYGLPPLRRLALLRSPPDFPGQLAGLPYPALNGSLWTITFEFALYLCVAALWTMRVLHRKSVMLGLTALALALSVAATYPRGEAVIDRLQQLRLVHSAIGDVAAFLKLAAAFFVGASFYLFRRTILPRLTPAAASCGAMLALAAMLAGPHTAEAGLTTFGAFALFWLAYKARLGVLRRINNSWDVSYGVYLYGWPAATLILWYHRHLSPWELAVLALPAALACGVASWWGVERWSKDLLRDGQNRSNSRLLESRSTA